MKIEFDQKKSIKNDLERGLPFECSDDFEWMDATYSQDTRKEYPEIRMIAIGYLYGKLHHVCFTPISGGVRVISLRRAHIKEIKAYEEETKETAYQ